MFAVRYFATCLMLFVLVAFGVSNAQAQSDYPTRPVRLVVGFGPGSAADITARLLAQRLTQNMGQPFVVENRGGAGSSIGAELVARAEKDGYTLFIGTNANVINAVISPNLPFNFVKDFAPVALSASAPIILVVHPSTGVTSVAELIALAKSKPGEIFFGSSGVATGPHLAGELFNMRTGVKLVAVQYQGSAAAMGDLLSGRITVMFAPASTVLAQIEEGKLKALASAAAKRPGVAPDLPTMEEAGVPDFDTSIWFGVMAPAGTPRGVIDRLSRAINEALQAPEVLTALRAQGLDPLGGTPEDFARHIESETKKWADVAQGAGLKK
jgi:tripartite-type tricarboxylate transporter receptor subunit TctC